MKKLIYEISSKRGGEYSKYDVEFKSLDANATQVDMKFSTKDAQWNHPGQKIGSLFDNGNYVSVNVQGKMVRLDYSQVEYMRMLLHAYDHANAMKRPEIYPMKLNKFEEVK